MCITDIYMKNKSSNNSSANTKGERLFEQYLKKQRYNFEYEALKGKTKPDYLVDTPLGQIICEIEDIVKSPKLQLGKGTVIRDSRHKKIQDKINNARKHFRPYKDCKLPCVLIIYNHSIMQDIQDMEGKSIDPNHYREIEDIQYAMEGESTTVVRVPTNPNHGQIEVICNYFGEKGSMTYRKEGKGGIQNRTISAVGLIDKPQSGIPRIRLVHNRHATVALSSNIFCDSLDEQYAADKNSMTFKKIN